MYSVIALEEVRVPREFKTFRGAQIAAINLSRKWESKIVILDSDGMEVGETEFHNWQWGNRKVPGKGLVYARFWNTPRELLA